MRRLQILLVYAFLTIFNGSVLAQAKMRTARIGAYTKYFQYLNLQADDIPEEAQLTSNAIAGLVFPVPNNGIASGTGFLIKSYRNDGKICMCTAAHNVNLMQSSFWSSFRTIDIYMKYLGQPIWVPQLNAYFNKTTSGFKSTVQAKLVESLVSNGQDAALFLINPQELPTIDFATLGYSFDYEYSPSSPLSYIIGHPYGMPQQLSDKLVYNQSLSANVPVTNFVIDASGRKPAGIGLGNSGSPVLLRGNNSFVTGIFHEIIINGSNSETIPEIELVLTDKQIPIIYDTKGFVSTKMSVLQAAIKKHCWDNKTEEEIGIGDYKKSVTTNNAEKRAEFYPTRTIASLNDLTIAANQPYRANNPGCILLKASHLTISCPITATADSKNIYGLAPTVALINGFSYTATGDNSFEMNSVVLEPTSAAASRFTSPGFLSNNSKPKIIATPSAAFTVKPNPSTTGIFEVTVPAATIIKSYTMTVTTIDAKPILQQTVYPAQKARINLSGKARGVYVLQIYDNNKIVYGTQLVY